MKRIIKLVSICFAAIFGACSRAAERPPEQKLHVASESIYDVKLIDINGAVTTLAQYRGKKILIVNTASKCGYTKQYSDLQKLHEEYGEKVAVLAFPCNQFGGQEPGTESEIMNFCKENYGVTFPVFAKVDVKGKNISPIYAWLTDKSKNGWNDQEPTWNFCKYLIDENGKLLAFYPARTEPMDEKIINQLIKK